MFKSVQSKYVGFYFQLTASGANSVLAVAVVEVEHRPEGVWGKLQTVVQIVMGELVGIVINKAAPYPPVSAE